MNDKSLNSHSFVSTYINSQSTVGRWRLGAWVMWKRLCWRIIISTTSTIKRLLDIGLSLVAIVLLSPLMAIICLLIKLEDGGPVLFRQLRTGLFGREFKMLKFRSMYVDAEKRLADVIGQNVHGNGVTFKIKNDPRITMVGRYLRKWSLDELPQFINVLRGEMSLVGPRPPLPREVIRYNLEERKRLCAKPGITCFWQINGRSNIPFPIQVKLDVDYIKQQSVWVDLKILAKTVPAVISQKGAY